ncbi:MAG: hypothetical protein AAB608_01710 [Patescibacteria group bacterium]
MKLTLQDVRDQLRDLASDLVEGGTAPDAVAAMDTIGRELVKLRGKHGIDALARRVKASGPSVDVASPAGGC